MPAFLFGEIAAEVVAVTPILKGGEVIAEVKGLAEPILAQKGMELVDIEYRLEHGRWVLRFFIDKPEGITVDDCGDVSTELGAILEVKDIIPHSYNLEVSSPGLDRALTREKDFINYKGRKVKIKTKQPISGRRNFSAILDDFKEGMVFLIDSEGKKWEIPFEEIEKARLAYSG
ncbi:MAG: ribosome maturation factor RimP [Deltaproteobacteria bacterium]|nr:ribosome maturation factor RimP [Deltaproteobacteria bacterium]